jgi:hypothetical protein
VDSAQTSEFVANHVRAQRRQVAALTEAPDGGQHVWAALEDIVAEDVGLPPQATEALFDAFLGRGCEPVLPRCRWGISGLRPV